MRAFEILEEEATADIGVRSHGTSLAEAFANMAIGMFHIMTDVKSIALCTKRSFEVTGDDLGELLYNFLEEFLFIRDVENLVFGRIDVSIDQPSLTATVDCLGERFDPDKHSSKIEIKAVTYHRMDIRHERGIWTAKVVFDI